MNFIIHWGPWLYREYRPCIIIGNKRSKTYHSIPELSAEGRGLLGAADVEDAPALGRRDDATAAQQATKHGFAAPVDPIAVRRPRRAPVTPRQTAEPEYPESGSKFLFSIPIFCKKNLGEMSTDIWSYSAERTLDSRAAPCANSTPIPHGSRNLWPVFLLTNPCEKPIKTPILKCGTCGGWRLTEEVGARGPGERRRRHCGGRGRRGVGSFGASCKIKG